MSAGQLRRGRTFLVTVTKHTDPSYFPRDGIGDMGVWWLSEASALECSV